MNRRWKLIARDVAILVVLTVIGGIIVGLAAAGRPLPMFALAASNILLGTVGFFIAGCLTRTDRWRHLTDVTIFAWLVGLMNVIFFTTTFTQWVIGLPLLFIMMAIGGSLSFLFVRQTPPE